MAKVRGVRERAREELTQEIKNEARRQLGEHGAQGLSLRAVARELEMASSAIYRYFPSRDDLLTALIIDAFNAVGAHVEKAEAKQDRADHLARWQAACKAVRTWAHAHPWEYALLYGSPVVGYRAPQDTAAPAARVPVVLLGIVADAHQAGELQAVQGPPLTDQVSQEIEHLVALLPALALQDVLRSNLAVLIAAWTQLYGLLSFELWGHLEGVVEDRTAIFEYATNQLAHLLGLRRRGGRG
ncbi:TetR/AcrR family transcriptional regulator [Tenggerimyces flavus]|uniref:TetR/AcrR family transcriptional regulator n=1 Tax=Tenggerimyces flavus TaxID=1708749 RepID=A0ABV7Y787_9ACTN|nr:TetR/AcrR family transcriptional regulator [Tenggerimyces flavus]MBM7791298.1 AcrR family transcriptional regulator [Tenggerimyces flavus]